MIALETALAHKPGVCDCGQDLAGCQRDHCPRCGCDVHRAA